MIEKNHRLNMVHNLTVLCNLFLTGVSFDLSDKELFCVEEQDLFDRVYSLIRSYSVLPSSCKFNLVESLRSNLSVLLPNVDSLGRLSEGQDGESPVLDRIASHRNAFKIYTFFLFSIVLAEESNIITSKIPKVLGSLSKYLYYSFLYVFTCMYVIASAMVCKCCFWFVKSFAHWFR